MNLLRKTTKYSYGNRKNILASYKRKSKLL